MSLMVTNGSEMIRYNPSSSSIEYSNTRGLSWMMRCRCSDMGSVRALTMHKGELRHLVASVGLREGKNT